MPYRYECPHCGVVVVDSVAPGSYPYHCPVCREKEATIVNMRCVEKEDDAVQQTVDVGMAAKVVQWCRSLIDRVTGKALTELAEKHSAEIEKANLLYQNAISEAARNSSTLEKNYKNIQRRCSDLEARNRELNRELSRRVEEHATKSEERRGVIEQLNRQIESNRQRHIAELHIYENEAIKQAKTISTLRGRVTKLTKKVESLTAKPEVKQEAGTGESHG